MHKPRPKYVNPFTGLPAPLELSGLCLISPTTYLKLHGLPFREMLTERFGESFAKRLTSTAAGKRAATAGLIGEMDRVLHETGTWSSDLRAALAGDPEAAERVQGIGPWETFLSAAGSDLSSRAWSFLVAVERACLPVERLVRARRLRDAKQAIQESLVLSTLFSPQAQELVTHASDNTRLLSLSASLALEGHLGHLVGREADVQDIDPTQAPVLDVLPCPDSQEQNAGARLFTWILQHAGVGTQSALIDRIPQRHASLDAGLVQKWSSGQVHPSPRWIRCIAKNVFGDGDYLPLWQRYWASRHIDLLGFYAHKCMQRGRLHAHTPLAGQLAPWPELPFGHQDFATWCQNRYRVWTEYHRREVGPSSS